MPFLVPTNSLLIGLTKEQLIRKRVCDKHFDKHQFDHEGRRLRYSYPCLLTAEEIAHGVPLNVAGWDITLEHSYIKEQDEEDVTETSSMIGCTDTIDHNYSKEQDDSLIKSAVLIGRADVILEQPSCSGTGNNTEIVMDTKQAFQIIKRPKQKNKLHGPDSGGTMAITAEIVECFDELFDSVNGYPGGAKRGKLRRAVKKDSQHHSFWIDAIKRIKSLYFIDKFSKHAMKSGKSRLVKVPSLQGWVTTLESFIRISKLLFDKCGVDYYYPRYINQDPLENFFGRLRALNYRNVNPDANAFVYSFKSLLISNVLSPHSKFANCEEDDGEALLNVKCLFENSNLNKENCMTYTIELPSSSQERPIEKISRDQVIF